MRVKTTLSSVKKKIVVGAHSVYLKGDYEVSNPTVPSEESDGEKVSD
jgi:hypothetical protein